MSEIPENFDPRLNPNFEFVPYDEDPAIQSLITDNDQAGRDLGQRVRAWQDAQHELRHQPTSLAAQTSLANAERNLEQYLNDQRISRSIREKQ